ncbi:MAG: anaerobic ribonucleoside-triphosphate reductase activating protein [Methanomassiliicoccaceae archaeon]|nr:anaerobic ribonucleoside-triphosphate reductase activating protein [Methanomassiliicoccaceae archaeon]
MGVAGFVKTTLQDWEGKSSCLISLGGCNLRCPYCNRPGLMERGGDMDTAPILGYIKENRDFLEAAVVSGGEPTMDEGLYRLLGELKKLKLKVKVDTNGCFPDVLDDIVGARLADKVCVNVMAPLDDASYSRAAGTEVDARLIRRSLDILRGSEAPYEIRTVIVPGVVTHESFVRMLKDLDGTRSMVIQQFDPRGAAGPMASAVPYPVPALVRMAETAKGYIERVRVRGV